MTFQITSGGNKMQRTVTIIILLAILTGMIAMPVGAQTAVESSSGDQNVKTFLPILMQDTAVLQPESVSIDLIIETDGSTEAVTEHVQALGGKVNFAYNNVPLVAVTVPQGKVSSLVASPNIYRSYTDRLMYLTVESGPKVDNELLSYVAEASPEVRTESIDPAVVDFEALPEGYANYLFTGAPLIWDETDFGEGTVVAVVDTGTAPNVCLNHAVIGAPGYPDGYNATNDGVSATSTENHWHGTHVAGVIASSCALNFFGAESDPLYQAISTYLPWEPDFVPVFGQAPGADIYPVKVFDTNAGGTPTSVILDGLDHILDLKRNGLLDIDIVNMSLGGETFADGRDTFDMFLLEFRKENILVVTSASNEGPTQNSLGSPATSFLSIAVGSLDYPASSRVLFEYLGLTVWPGEPGQGMVMRPTDEVRVANHSSRGPMSDGRFGPDLTALGMWNFATGPNNELRWAGGTSFASPGVAGAAALLNSYYENRYHRDTPGWRWRNSLFVGANPDVVDPLWQDMNTIGYGALDVVAALEALQDRSTGFLEYPVSPGKLEPNILGNPVDGDLEVYQSPMVTLNPSETFDAVFEIAQSTDKVTLEFFEIQAPDNSAYAYWPNALEVHVQSAKRTAFSHPVNILWYPYFDGDSFSVVIEDGPWTVAGTTWDYLPMEPGLMKVTLAGDFSNESPVSFKMRVIRENSGIQRGLQVARGKINMGDSISIPVEIKPGVSLATFDLLWQRDWQKFPTSNIDMFIYDPDSNLVSQDGATGNSPERALIEDPVPGTWLVQIEGTEMYFEDNFTLMLKLE